MKLRRKLLAAGFAFGATALTLTTSTFAWYTANTEVTAKTVSGKTSAEADSDSIYIASAKDYNTDFSVAHMNGYGKEATPVYTAAEALKDTTKKMQMIPVSYVDATGATAQYLPLSSAKGSTTTATVLDVAEYGSYSELNVVEFVLRFRTASASDSATKIYFSKFDLVNTVTTATSYRQIALTNNADTGLTTTGVSTAGEYGVDFRKALKMTITATDMTNNTTLGTTVKTEVYDFESLGYTDSKKFHDDENIDATNKANALGYLNTVMGYSLSTPSNYLSTAKSLATAAAGSLTDDTAYSPFAIPTSGYLEVRFTLWLDGWDSYCYDVCRQQGFDLDMKFTTDPKLAVIKTA